MRATLAVMLRKDQGRARRGRTVLSNEPRWAGKVALDLVPEGLLLVEALLQPLQCTGRQRGGVNRPDVRAPWAFEGQDTCAADERTNLIMVALWALDRWLGRWHLANSTETTKRLVKLRAAWGPTQQNQKVEIVKERDPNTTRKRFRSFAEPPAANRSCVDLSAPVISSADCSAASSRSAIFCWSLTRSAWDSSMRRSNCSRSAATSCWDLAPHTG